MPVNLDVPMTWKEFKSLEKQDQYDFLQQPDRHLWSQRGILCGDVPQ